MRGPSTIVCLAFGLACLLSASNGRFNDVIMDSRHNDFYGTNGYDEDMKSCAKTGIRYFPWYKVDLGSPQLVTGIKFNGILPKIHPTEVKVGGLTNAYGLRDGHFNNTICAVLSGTNLSENMTVLCDTPVTGRYVSLEPAGNFPTFRPNDNTESHQLTVCELWVL